MRQPPGTGVISATRVWLSRHRTTIAFYAIGVLLTALTFAGPYVYDEWEYEENGLVPLLLAAGLLTIAATVLVRRVSFRPAIIFIFAVAAIMRFVALTNEPFLSTDVYRYVWDGRVQAAGINPYRYIPVDPALTKLRDDDIYPNINRAEYARTIYPPVAQAFFLAANQAGNTLFRWISPEDGTAPLRAILILCEAVIVAILWSLLRMLQRPVTLIVAYAWHPLPVWEGANAGHADILMATLLMIGIWLLVRMRRVAGVVFVALAALVKPYALAATPAFWRPWDWRAPLAVIATIVFCYLPYAGLGSGVIGFMPTYLQEEGLQSGDGFWLVRLVHFFAGDVPFAREAYLAAALTILAALALRVSFSQPEESPERKIANIATLLIAGLFFLSPNYPWYYLGLVPLLALGAGPPAWAMTVGGLLLHLSWPQDYDLRLLVLKSAVNSIFIATLAIGVLRYRMRSSAAKLTPPAAPPRGGSRPRAPARQSR